ncbi:MAG: hypothetical protein Q9210_004737, partial [Variospora velana]
MTEFVGRLKRARVTLREKQPMLASYAVKDRRVCCLWNDPVHLESWLRESFFIVHDSTSGIVDDSTGDGAHTAYGHFAPTKHADLYFFPETKDILIRGPHYLIDGIGHLMLLHHLLTNISQREPAEESLEIQPSADYLSPPLGRPVNLAAVTPSQDVDVKQFVGQFLAGSFPPMGLPMQSSRQSAPDTPLKYGQDLSSILVKEVSIQGEFVTPSVIIQVWSFNDRLTMQMEWNDKYYDSSDMEEYFRLVEKELRFDLLVSPVVVFPQCN